MKIHLTYIAIITGLVLLALFLFDRLQKKQHEAEDLMSSAIEKDAIIKYHTNKLGQTVAEKDAAILQTKQIAQAYPKIVDDLNKQFDIKFKDMRAYISNQFSAHGEGNTTVNHYHYTDSAGVNRSYLNLKVSDGYLSFRAKVYDSLHAHYDYDYLDTAKTVISVKKKWMFGTEKYYSTTIFSNRNSRITGTTNVLVDNIRDKRWGVFIGVSYLPFMYGRPWTDQVQPTIGVGYVIKKF